MTLFPDVARQKTDIRTLGMYQPFAELMLHGKIETRWRMVSRKIPFPLGKYLIYSTQKVFKEWELKHLCGQHQWTRVIERVGNISELNRQSAICFATLKDIVMVMPGMEDQTFIKHVPPSGGYARFGLIFDDVKPLVQTPFKEGKQGVGFLYQDSFSELQLK